MWSTCKVVHHVHAVGALVHQAAQARPLQARSCGGLGRAGAGAPGGDASAAGRSLARQRPGLSQYQQLIRTFCFTKTEKRSTILRKGIANMAQYMTEKEILTSFPRVRSRLHRQPYLSRAPAHGIFRSTWLTASTSWSARPGDLKNYTLPACAELVHSIGIDRFTVGLHGYTQK